MARLGGSKNLEKSRSEASWRRKCSKMLASRPPDVENARKCSLRGLLTSKNARKCSLRGLLTSKNRRKCSLRSLQTSKNRRKCSLRSLCDHTSQIVDCVERAVKKTIEELASRQLCSKTLSSVHFMHGSTLVFKIFKKSKRGFN